MKEETVGCVNQCRCALSVYLMSIVSLKYRISTDREIGAPGSGKRL